MSKRWAVLIGVSGYHESLGALQFSVSDARLMQETLTSEVCGFAQEDTLLLTDESPRDHQPTYGNIHSWLASWLAHAGKDDMTLVYFAGHGREVDGRAVLAPIDATLDSMNVTGIPVEYVSGMLRRCNARQKVLILDACHSGAGRDVVTMTPAFQSELDQGKGIYTIASCGADQVSHEWPEKGHGLFTWYLTQAVRQVAPKPDGIVLLDDVYRWTRDHVREWSLRKRISQNPIRICHVDGMIAIGRYRWKHTADMTPEALAEYERAEGLAAQGKLEEALATVERGLEDEPLSYDLRKLRRVLNEQVAAQADLRQAAEHERLAARVARLLHDAGQYELDRDLSSAEACLAEADALAPQSEAAAHLERLRARRETSGQSLPTQLGDLFFRADEAEQTGAYETAIELHEEVLRLYPGNRRASGALGLLQDKLQRRTVVASLHSLYEEAKRQKDRAREDARQLLRDGREYKDLAMDAELSETLKDFAETRKALAGLRMHAKVARVATEAWKRQDHPGAAEKALLEQKTIRENLVAWVNSESEIEQQIARVALPGVEAAVLLLTEWQAKLRHVVSTSEHRLDEKRREHKQMMAAEEIQLRRKWERRCREYEAEQGRLRQDYERRLEEYEKEMASRPPQGFLRRLLDQALPQKKLPQKKPPSLQKQKGKPPSEQDLQRILAGRPRLRFKKCWQWPGLPDACAKYLGATCIEAIPADIPEWMQPEELRDGVEKAVEAARPLPEAKYAIDRYAHEYASDRYANEVAEKMGVPPERARELMMIASRSILTLLKRSSRQTVAVAGLGGFRVTKTGRITLRVHSGRASSSQRLWSEFHKRHNLTRDDVRATVTLLAGIPGFCARGATVELPGLGVFVPDNNAKAQVRFKGYSLKEDRGA